LVGIDFEPGRALVFDATGRRLALTDDRHG
jgi:hypothetical protein